MMNISPIVSLAFSVNSNPGVYALLLGSGVSRSAGIPTGYEITKDLIRKLASLEGVNPEPDPLTWYRLSHGGAPSYTDLLAALAQTPEERNALLRGYFEPTEQEQGASAGGKTPQVAHKAIAALMAAGYIRIVITTNFDRLLERAAEAVGLTPMVIASADAALGAIPLPHAKATIIKVNGDYLDSRIRNTLEELSLYEPPLEQLLDRVLDEFGLIISGWSGDWDFALRSAIKRISNRRFATFWCLRGAVSESVQSLIALRAATAVKIESADSFFQELQEKVFALRELNAEHPLSPLLAAQTVKRFLPRTEDRIRLHDLVLGETEKVYERCSPERFPADATFSPEQLTRRAAAYETITEVLQAMFVVGCYWGGADHESMWVRSVQRLANVSNPAGGPFYESWARMSYYPSLLCAYAGGIAAKAGGKYKTFDTLL
ncbi:MAG: SIR2 family protein, partial [Acidobacteriales bacterium]|nr:SIR2 family protein [Terriglobales bacterium]